MNIREWTLPVFTILMQIAVGAHILLWGIRARAGVRFSHDEMEKLVRNPILVVWFTSLVAMIGAHLHLSRPAHSIFAILNFKSSWLSREIVFTFLFFLTTLLVWYLSRYYTNRPRLVAGVGWLGVFWGLLLVYCMARIYLIPTQTAWNSVTVIISFYVTTLLLGCMTLMCLMILDMKFTEIKKMDITLQMQFIRYSFAGLVSMMLLAVVMNLTVILVQIMMLGQGDITARTSLNLLIQLYLPLLLIRLFLLITASLQLAFSMSQLYKDKITPQNMLVPVYISSLMIFVAEIVGRFLFYATHIRTGLF
ncbi:MAG: dimethyl sulfoxide reductase anchor subunit family protein [Chloroflexota bacterium]